MRLLTECLPTASLFSVDFKSKSQACIQYMLLTNCTIKLTHMYNYSQTCIKKAPKGYSNYAYLIQGPFNVFAFCAN